jgi:hypothetical protein
MNQTGTQRNVSTALKGRDFVHPVFDYMLIGGGLSLVVTGLVLAKGSESLIVDAAILPYLFLLSNAAHFAASTVRLYTKPGSYSSLPFLTMAFPLISLAVLGLCISQAGRIGPHLQSLYLTWSPFHYAAQAYGLAVMYSFRSGCLLSPTDKKLLWWVSMLPFFYNFVVAEQVGLRWMLSPELLAHPAVETALKAVVFVLPILAFVTPILLFAKVWGAKSGPMPLISILAVVTNGIWFFVLTGLNAFAWATVFHGIQYLAIVIIFHLKDQMSRPDNRHGSLYHVVWFYAVSLLLGYGLFNCLPLSYTLAGFGKAESMLLVVAVINIHHFIVDAYIWRLKKSDGNRQIVDAGLPSPA